MPPRIKALLSIGAGLVALLACDLSSLTVPAPAGSAATLMAQTLQALTPLATPLFTPTPLPSTPSATTIPALLPRALYFLANDSTAGYVQVFRLERDGQTKHQVTYEPADVKDYDVSPRDGSVVYVSGNQLLLVEANGAGRRVLVDGGAVDAANPWATALDAPRWSPDGQTIAFHHGGLSFYALSSGTIDQVLTDQLDTSTGFPIVRELYTPERYSPQGSRLLVRITFYEGGSFGIYTPSENTLVRFHREDGGAVCCNAFWIPDGSGLYAANPSMGMFDSGLWYVDATSGNMTTLLPGAAPDGTYNFADAPHLGMDGRLYFFFNNLEEIPSSGRTPLYMVRSAPNGMSERVPLRPEAFEDVNEILWAPDASLAVLAFASREDVLQGGMAEVVYPDGRAGVPLVEYAYRMKWGP